MDALSLTLGLGITAVAASIGYRMRTISHAILPIRDPAFLFLLLMEMVLVVADCCGVLPWSGFAMEDDVLTISDAGSIEALCIIALDIGYLMGYVMCRPGDVM